MYAMTATRPDIASAIGVLSRYNHDPSNEHLVALKRVFRYLNGTKGGDCVSEEHLENEHSGGKENAHSDVMSIRTMLDARMTIN